MVTGQKMLGKAELVPGTAREPVLDVVFGDQALSWSSFSSPSELPRPKSSLRVRRDCFSGNCQWLSGAA